MSANPLNLATPPAPGANAMAVPGGAAQAAGAGKGGASGPLAGFEALLATLFGDPGVAAVAPAPGGAGKAVTGAKAANASKTPQAAPGADKHGAPAGDTVSPNGSDGASATVSGAALALLVPTPVPIPVPTPALAGEVATAAAKVQSGPAGNGSAPVQAGAATPPQLADIVPGGDAAVTGTTKPGIDKAKALPAALIAGATPTTAKAPAPAVTPDKPASPTGPARSSGPVSPSPAGLPAPGVLGAQAAVPPAETGVAKAISPGAREIAAKAAAQAAQAAKPTGLEAPRVDAAATPSLFRAGDGPLASSSGAGAEGRGPGGGSADREARSPAPEIKGSAADAAPVAGGLDTQSTTTPATLIHAAAALRGSPQTVASLAAQIARKLEGRSSRFDVQLDPAGLGKVDVRIEIGASGRMTAAMSFDTPQAAAELRARAGELQRALEQAGFDLSGGMSFDVAGDGGRGAQARQNETGQSAGAGFRGRAFQAALEIGGEAVAPDRLNLRRTTSDSVDIRI
ncbi:flagellar hook-length control protein FliK [Phenylobacterium sp.]|uniref:flagellar hook-length control protein FliK n=1 Tax=Phenylobacterium sp. TaxID=1871053 RepID=UPI00286BE16C|nr:flagellar hook-length control protein FliK [Phenylobacterium sp.]